MRTRTELLNDRARLESKAAGALIGLAVGDAIGDLGRSQDHRARFGIVTNLYPEGKSTDDTEFAVSCIVPGHDRRGTALVNDEGS